MKSQNKIFINTQYSYLQTKKKKVWNEWAHCRGWRARALMGVDCIRISGNWCAISNSDRRRSSRVFWARADLDFVRNQEYKFDRASSKSDLEIRPKFAPNLSTVYTPTEIMSQSEINHVLSKKKAVVVGAGPVGCLAAMALAKRGWRVNLYERRPGMFFFSFPFYH